LDKDKAKEWLANGVQPSVTMHNILVSEGVLDAKKINPLSKKSPIIDHEAIKKAEEEAAAKAEADKAAAVEDAPAEEEASSETETPAEEAPETPAVEEASAEEASVEEAEDK